MSFQRDDDDGHLEGEAGYLTQAGERKENSNIRERLCERDTMCLER